MDKIILPETDEKLLEECEVETFRSGGPGGQHVNKTDSAVRVRHLPTGLVVVCQEERSQLRNRGICLEKLRDKVAKLNYRAPRRIPTKKTYGSKQNNLKEKSIQSKKKQLRGKPRRDAED